MVLGTRVVIFRRITGNNKTLKVGSTLLNTETGAPLGRVVGYYFGHGSGTKPHYLVRLDSDIQMPHRTSFSFVDEEFAEYIDDEENLCKRFYDPNKNEFVSSEKEDSECESTTTTKRSNEDESNIPRKKRVLERSSNHFDSQTAHAPQFQCQHFRRLQSTTPNRGAQDNFKQPFCMQQHPCLNAAAPKMYQQEEKFMRPTNLLMRHENNQQNQIFPNVLPNQASKMYNQQQQFMTTETNQPNQMGIVPNLLQSQAPLMPMMYNQQHDFRSSFQITEPNLRAQVSTMFAAAPMVYNQQQQYMRPETNQQNQMGTISNQALTMITADLMMNLQQYLSGQISTILQGGWSGSYGLDQNYSNQQHFSLSQPRPDLNFNPETQPMQSQVFHASVEELTGVEPEDVGGEVEPKQKPK